MCGNRLNRMVLNTLLVAVVPLAAQGYETKFKTIGFQPGEVFHTDENVQVSLSGGGLEVSIPFGPALPGPIPIRPVVHYHGKYVQSLSCGQPVGADLDNYVSCIESGDTINFRRWLPPKPPFAEIHPGYLLFSVGGKNQEPGQSTIQVTPYSGQTAGYNLGMPGSYTYRSTLPGDVAAINALVSALAPEWIPFGATTQTATLPRSCHVIETQPLGSAIGLRMRGGSTLIFGPLNAHVYSSYPMTSNGPPETHIDAARMLVPNEILQIDGDLITLWRRNRNVYHQTSELNGLYAWWDRSVFHPVWIKTRNGFRVNVEVYRASPAYGPWPYDGLAEGGWLCGYRVSSSDNATWFQVGGPAGTTPAYPVSFGGMAISGTTGVNFHFHGAGGESWQPGTMNGYTYCPPQIGEENCATADFSADSITYGSLTTSFQWGGPQGQLSRLTTPNGKTYTFTYGLFRGFGPNPGLASTERRAWDFSEENPNATNFWSSVTQMDVSDGTQSRSTAYQWRIPQVNPVLSNWWPSGIVWISGTQGVAQTLSDGQTILHVFAPAVDLPFSTVIAQLSPSMSSTLLDQVGRTFMAQRQTHIARYYYAAGETGWNGFISNGADPAPSNWYKRELMEGFDLRSWETSLTQVNSNTEPRPTRIIKEERGGPVEVSESDGWDSSRNEYSVSRVYHLPPNTATAGQFWAPGLFGGASTYPIPTGAIDLAQTTTTFAPIEAGLFARPKGKVARQLVAPLSGTTGTISDHSYLYKTGAQAHLIQELAQNATDGSALQLKAGFAYGSWGGFTQVSTVNLSATGLSGSSGYTYDYDSTGRWLTSIQPQGLFYKEQEPDHDWGGRTTVHIDTNGIKTSYTWDDYGRITGINPPSPELPTIVAYDPDFRGAMVTKGVATTQYRYNSFGELIWIKNPNGDFKQFSYDMGGRRVFESVWASNKGTQSYFDSRGRLIQTVNTNGDITDIRYPSPLLKTVTQYPDVYGTPSTVTTTFENDSLGRLVKVTNAMAEVTQYTYDPSGKLKKVEQGTQVRTWNFNGLGWLTNLVQPESGTTTYSDFGHLGKPRTTSYAGRVLNTSYDTLGRQTDLTTPDGSVAQHLEFDGGPPFNGKLRYSTDRSSQDQSLVRLDYGYGGLNGRLASIQTTVAPSSGTAATLFTQSIDYDTYGRPSSTTLPSGRVVSLVWDSIRDVPTGVSASSGLPGGFGSLNSLATISSLNPSNNPLGIVFGNGASSTFTYSPDQNRLASMTHLKTGINAFTKSWRYGWDSAGWLRGDGEDTFTYDKLERLVTVNVKLPGSAQIISQNFNYDTYGNLISKTFPSGVPSPLWKNLVGWAMTGTEISQMGLTNQFPGTAGNVLTGAQYDAQGNLTQINKQPGSTSPYVSLTYDGLGRVTQMIDSELGISEVYSYTAEGLRTRIQIYKGTNPLSRILVQVKIRLYNNQRQLITQYDCVQE